MKASFKMKCSVRGLLTNNWNRICVCLVYEVGKGADCDVFSVPTKCTSMLHPLQALYQGTLSNTLEGRHFNSYTIDMATVQKK